MYNIPRGLTVPTYDLDGKYALLRGIPYLRSRCSRAESVITVGFEPTYFNPTPTGMLRIMFFEAYPYCTMPPCAMLPTSLSLMPQRRISADVRFSPSHLLLPYRRRSFLTHRAASGRPLSVVLRTLNGATYPRRKCFYG